MTDHRPRFWHNVRPFFHEQFWFWPDHEDLIWAKSIWPVMEDAGFFSDHDHEADAWTRRHIIALAMLYAESAWRFGTPDYQRSDSHERQWLAAEFGSMDNLNEILDEVGRAVCFHFPGNRTFVGDPDFFVPLIKSLVIGSGFYQEGPDLQDYLSRVRRCRFEMCEFREDRLFTMWIGGHFAWEDMLCVP